MFVKVCGKNVEVVVSNDGMFHDAATGQISAPTLKGLAKKLRAQVVPASGIAIQTRDGQKGTVLSRVKSKGWRRQYFIVRWDDGKQSEVHSSSSFMRPLTKSEEQKWTELKANVAKKSAVVDEKEKELAVARHEEHEYLRTFSLTTLVETAYPII